MYIVQINVIIQIILAKFQSPKNSLQQTRSIQIMTSLPMSKKQARGFVSLLADYLFAVAKICLSLTKQNKFAELHPTLKKVFSPYY